MAREIRQSHTVDRIEIYESDPDVKEDELPLTNGDHEPAGGRELGGIATEGSLVPGKSGVESSAKESARIGVQAPDTLSKPPLLCLGAPRTGTTSLSQALEILGVAPIHHGMQHTDDEELDWEVFNRAADATFPTIPSYTGKAFSRSDWDELCSRYAAVTDVASYYAVSLITAYPDAKVILVERDVESWLKSIHAIFGMWENPITDWAISYIGPRSGSIKAEVARKYHLGWTQSTRTSDIMGNARGAYERHYKEIRELVPPEQLLDFKLKDGWGPLCKFLDKPIPQGVDFPRANDAASYKAFVQRETNISLFNAVKNTLLWKELKRA